MKSATIEKTDFSKTHKDLYTATAKIKEVKADKATFLALPERASRAAPSSRRGFNNCIALPIQ
jgi:hypothetical protein